MEMKVTIGLDEETKRIAWELLTNLQIGGSTPKITLTPVDNAVDPRVAELEKQVVKLTGLLEKSQEAYKKAATKNAEAKTTKVETPPTVPVEEVLKEKHDKKSEEALGDDYEELLDIAKELSKTVSKKGKRAEVLEYMKSFGATSISAIPKDKIKEYITGVEAIGNGD